MFPTTSLFGICPIYSTCPNRGFPPCLFSHSKPQVPLSAPPTLSNVPQKRQNEAKDEEIVNKRKAVPVVQVKTKVVEKKGSDRPEERKTIPVTQGSTVASSSSVSSSKNVQTKKEPIEANVNTGPPRIGMVKGAAHTPLVTRQKMITAFHSQFVEIYTPGILPTSTRYSLASQHALSQESTLYSKSNKTTYRNSCISTLARLKKRPAASRVVDTGTMEEWDSKQKEREEKERGRLTRERVEDFVHDVETLRRFGYLLEVPEGEGGDIPNETGQKRECDRCKNEFVVKEELDQNDREACSYHYGKMISEKIGGVRQRVWSCCPTPQAAPCQLGPHVFKDTDPLDLHSRVGFISTSSLSPPPSSSKRSELQDLVALDCELFYTTAGMSLARLTVVSSDGELLYDTHVKPPRSTSVVDLNTRYSGIREEDLEKAEKGIEEVRRELGRWVGKETVVVGHGVENDLNALRVVHKRVIDTAILFPHPNRGTWRYALRNLTKEYLKKFIQDSDPTIGHSAKDDALAALELVRWKVLQKLRGKES
ncbi:uncharacterized protein JCM6883_006819 [Sporobolomyces salmoneus]|uniref:uncharacterized protein n=1 Tax=Sporobolomyces salmoneus TaxID=183962 RepID=UPI003175C6F3